jgi:hypothetical protein
MMPKGSVLMMCWALLFHLISGKSKTMHCRDPDLGGQSVHQISQRKFLVIGGAGAGIGNFLIFYPAAYYFAALTGRDVLIKDDSLIGELCKVLACGFPFVSQVAAAFPSLIDINSIDHYRGAKTTDFHRHMNGEDIINDKVILAHGYKFMSGWYLNYNHSQDCISQLTGCESADVSCHDRHALQRLVRGPFKARFTALEEEKLIGVPENLKHGIMTLPHSFAPRLDAAVHLRSQFKHFEYLVGPDDGAAWDEALQEQNYWLDSTDFNKGEGLYKVIEAKLMEELPAIRAEKLRAARRKALIIGEYKRYKRSLQDRSPSSSFATDGQRNVSQLDYEFSHDTYKGDGQDKVYVYIASDNERVKTGLCNYLIGHAHIATMRVKNHGLIVHAKNLGYLRDQKNSSGVMNLVLDWYIISLANNVFAWRRDTDILSTFAQSAQRVSGNIDAVDSKIHLDEDGDNEGVQQVQRRREGKESRVEASS